MEDLNDILKLSGMKTKTVKKNLNESYTNEPDEKYAPVDAILDQGTDLNRKKQQNAVGGFTGDNPMTEEVNEDEVRELKLYIDNDADLYRQQGEPIMRNLSRKWDKGIYDHELAQKLWYYLAVNGAKKYGQEHSTGDGLRIFSPDVRRAVAKELADDWMAELKAGNKMDEAEVDLEEMLADILISEDAQIGQGGYGQGKVTAPPTKKQSPDFGNILGKALGGSGMDDFKGKMKGNMDSFLKTIQNKIDDKRISDLAKQGRDISSRLAGAAGTSNSDNIEDRLIGKKRTNRIPNFADMIDKIQNQVKDFDPSYLSKLLKRSSKMPQIPLGQNNPNTSRFNDLKGGFKGTGEFLEGGADKKSNPAAGYGDETSGPVDDEGNAYVNPEFAKHMADQEKRHKEQEKNEGKDMKINELMGVQPTAGSGYKSPNASLASAPKAKPAVSDPRGAGGVTMGQGPKSAPTVSTKPATTGINLGADIPKSKPAPTKMAASGQGGYGQGKVTAPPTQTAKAPAANPFNVAAGGVGKMDGSNLAKAAPAQAKAPAANPFNVSAGMVANMGGGSAPKAAPAKQTAGINLGADIPKNAPAVATQPAPKKQFKKSVAFGQAAESKQLNDILKLSGLEPKESVNEGILSDMAAKSEMDHEIQMARGQLYKCAKYSIELHNMLKGISEEQGLEAWVQAKITKASDYLSAVKHYLEYEMLSNGEMPVEAVEPEVETEMDLGETTTAGAVAAVVQPLGAKKKVIKR